MNKPFFKKNDFSLCSVPVPHGYPQSQTHAGIAFYNGKFYLTTSPYPGRRYGIWESRIRAIVRKLSFHLFCNNHNGERFENPCLYIGYKPEGDIPIFFKLMQRRALIETPEPFYGYPSYNSDPDIYIEDGVLHILNRTIIRTKTITNQPYTYITRLYLIKGLDENGHFKMISNQLLCDGCENMVSPSMVKFQGRYIMAFLDNSYVNSKVVFNNLFLSKSDSIEEAIKAKDKRPIIIDCGDMIPWHMSLFHHDDVLYSIITCTQKDDNSSKMWQMLGEFNKDLSALKIFQTPLSDFNSYRGSALVREDGIFILYSTTVWERIRGSKSIDGRDVIVSKCLFTDLLEQVRR